MRKLFTFYSGGSRVDDAARPPTPGDEACVGRRTGRASYLSPGAVATSRLSVRSDMADAAAQGKVSVPWWWWWRWWVSERAANLSILLRDNALRRARARAACGRRRFGARECAAAAGVAAVAVAPAAADDDDGANDATDADDDDDDDDYATPTKAVEIDAPVDSPQWANSQSTGLL